MTIFIAIVSGQGNTGYIASFPDFAGCAVAAPTVDLAIARAKEALLAHIERALGSGQEIPIPTAADSIGIGDALLLAAVEVPDDVRVLQVGLAIPALSLARVDSFARRHGLTRSALLVEAVDRWIAQEGLARDRGEVAYDGPTLFDFSNPLELKVETMVAGLDPRGEPPSDVRNAIEQVEPMNDADGITAELARLLDESSELRPQDNNEHEPQRRLSREE